MLVAPPEAKRIKVADCKSSPATSLKRSTAATAGVFDVALTYDERGNIETLSRYGLTPTEDCLAQGLIDQLDYTYADSNYLAMVTDEAPCPENKYLQPTIDNSELHAADMMIIADNTINSGLPVTYQAGTNIRLMPGFRVSTGSRFSAKIGDCPQSGFETGGYSQRNVDISKYDVNGNLRLDPQKGIQNVYNHLDLPELITLEDGKTVTFTYDATGTLLAKVLKDANGAVLETRDYIGGTEYVDGVLESIYHGEGRLHYVNSSPQMEYQTSDHLGNTRLVYADLNGNGIIETPSEILDEIHYYPNGLKMEGYWMNSQRFRYTFNGIEGIDDFGLNVNRATFRTLDPELGRWWSVDPKATVLMGLSPYNSMNNSPIVFNDPNGDVAPLIAIGAAVIGGGINVATHWDDIMKGGFSLGTAATAFGIGALGAVASAYTGGAASAYLGLGTTGALAGLVGGVAGEAVGGPITGGLNAAFFHDNYTQADWVKGMLWGGVIGAGLGALDAAIKGLNPLLGDFTPGGGSPKLATGSSGVDDVAKGKYNGPDYMWSPDDLGSIYKGNSNAGPQVVVRASGTGGGGSFSPRSSLSPTHWITKSKSQMKALMNDIRANGIKDAIPYVEHEGVKYLVGGHHRYYAAQKLGIQSVPTIQVQLPFAGYNSVEDLFLIPGKHPGYWKFMK